MTSPTPAQRPTSELLPQGRWHVVPQESDLTFSCRGMFGLWLVRGTFQRFSGFLDVRGRAVTGELVVESASVDTRLAFRDRHLRASDFFDVDRYPTFAVALHGIEASADGAPQFAATLKMRAGQTAVTGPLQIAGDEDRLRLTTVVTVDRAAAGLDQRHHGMVATTARLSAELALTQDPEPGR